jgi:hypothetical protein
MRDSKRHRYPRPGYAYRAKSIKNKPKINEDPKDAMIREFQDEIKRLRDALAAEQVGD